MIEVVMCDITKLDVDVIVNAANTTLLGGGGVDGAIHKAAGPELLEACVALNGCATGEAKLTKGFDLPARFIVHTVGPVWKDGDHGEEEFLANCYRNSFKAVRNFDIKTIAFPAISTGVYRFPISRAVKIAYREANKYPKIKIYFVCFDELTYKEYI